MTDDEKKFTQADMDRAIAERLAREKTKYADYDEIKAERDELKTKVADHEKISLEAARAKVVAELKLPPGMGTRLQGETEEELKADGAKLLKELGPREPVGGSGQPPGDVKKPLTREAVKAMTPDQIIANMDQIKAQMKEGTLK